MAYASRTYSPSGTTTTFALTNSDGNNIPYIQESDISVTHNGTTCTNAASGTNTYQFDTAGTSIVFNTGVTGTVILKRDTQLAAATVTYTAGSTLTAIDLNNADNQIRYGLQEFSDLYDPFNTGTGDLEALGGVKGGSETWVSSNAFAATTSAIDARIGTTVNTALTTDVSGGDGVTIVDNSPGAGQIRIDLDADIATLRNMQTGAATALALLTSTEVAVLDGATLTTTELNYVDGVTSAVQTQLDAKQSLDSELTTLATMSAGTASALKDLTQTEVQILDQATVTTAELNVLAGIPGTLTAAELGYVDGVTSAIQTQLNAKQSTNAKLEDIADLTPTDSNIIVGNGSTWVAESGVAARTSLGAQTLATDLTNLSSCQTGGSAALAALSSTEIQILDGATPSTTELNYVDGVSSAIQGQLDGKQPLDAELSVLAGMTGGTASILANGSGLSATLAEIDSICENRAAQTTVTDDDAKIPTSGAVVDYVTGAVTAVGGFVTVATEVTFPNSQPDADVVVSVADAGGLSINNSGVASGATTAGGSAVAITGIPNALYGGVGANPDPNVLAAGVGLQLVSSGSSNSYAYHKLLATEADVAQLSGDINDFNERYRVSDGVPSGTDHAGDLYYDTGSDKMLVRNAANNAWEEVQSIGNFYIATLSPAFNGILEDFTVSNAPSNAQQLLISINGVVQKPNAGTSRPSEGFALNGSTVLFSDPPATSSPYFAVVIGSNVNIGAPSNNTVGTDQLQSGAVTNDKVNASAAIDYSKLAALADGNILVGNGSNVATSVNPSGDIDISNAGVFSIAADAVTAAKIGVLDAALQFGDSVKAQFGTGNDLEIYHNGSSGNYIDSVNKDLYLRCNLDAGITGGDIILQPKSGENSAIFRDDGAVELYYNNVKTVETYDASDYSGITVLGDEGGNAVINLHADEGDDDADKWQWTAQTNGASYIKNYSNGSSYEYNIKMIGGGAVELYYDHSKRLETISTGATVTGSLGIGTTSPARKLHLHQGSSAANYLTFTNTTTGVTASNGFTIGINSSEEAILNNYSATNIKFHCNGSERLSITSAGRVGINRSSPDSNSMLDVMSDLTGTAVNSNRVALFRTNGGGRDAHITLSNSSNTAVHIGQISSDLYFTTNNAERLRITSTGNIGINQDNPNKAKLHVVADSGSTDKIVAKFRNPQGAANVKAKIGFVAGYSDTANDTEGQAYIGAQREGSGNNAALIFETSDGSTVTERGRIRSGGGLTFNGDTAAANALDDYEEGTWTPAVTSFQNGTITVSSSTYVKVGQLVHVQAYISFSNDTDSSDLYITQLPFTVGGGSTHYSQICTQTNANIEDPALRAQGNTTTLRGCKYSSNSGDSKISYTNVKNKWLIFGGTYRST